MIFNSKTLIKSHRIVTNYFCWASRSFLIFCYFHVAQCEIVRLDHQKTNNNNEERLIVSGHCLRFNNVIFYMFFVDIIWCYYIQPLRLTNFDSFEQQWGRNTHSNVHQLENRREKDSCGLRRPFGDLSVMIKNGKAKVGLCWWKTWKLITEIM